MTARSLVSPRFSAISMPRIGMPSKRGFFHLAQLTMVMGYVVLIFNPFDGDSMLLGFACQAVALGLYGVSRGASQGPLST